MQQSFPKQKRGFRILNEIYIFLMKYKHIEFLDEIYIHIFLGIFHLVRTQTFTKNHISYLLLRKRPCQYQGVRNVFFPETFVYVLICHLLGKIPLFFPDIISHFIHRKCQVDFIFVQD